MIISIVVLVLLMFLAFAYFQASPLQNIHIVKEVTIKTEKQKTFDMVKYVKNFPKWSPFLAQDPTQNSK